MAANILTTIADPDNHPSSQQHTSPTPGHHGRHQPRQLRQPPEEEVQAIASMGGKAAHEKAEKAKDNAAKDSKESSPVKDSPNGNESRNPDGTFKKGSPEAAQAGHIGGLRAAGKEDTHPGRREDGTFLPGSEAAKEAGQRGGEVHAAHVAAEKK